MFLKILVLLGTLAVAQAGVRTLTPEQELRALELFQNFCGGDSSNPYGSSYGTTHIFCKSSDDDFTEVINHKVTVPPTYQNQDQVIFIQPPAYNYKHYVEINGGGVQYKSPTIYVLPPKNNHLISTNYVPGPQTKPEKPHVYYLNNQRPHQQPAQSEPPQYPQPPPPPPPSGQYLPPPSTSYLSGYELQAPKYESRSARDSNSKESEYPEQPAEASSSTDSEKPKKTVKRAPTLSSRKSIVRFEN